MSETQDPETQLLRDTLDAYKEEHSELSENWRNLDGKAQGVIAVAGILLAGMFAFVRTLSQAATCGERWFVTVAAISIMASIALALVVLWIRTVPAAPLGESLEPLVDDLLDSEDGMEPDRLHNLSRDHARMWKSTNVEIQKVNEFKARYVQRAQGVLMLGIVVVVIFTLIKVWGI